MVSRIASYHIATLNELRLLKSSRAGILNDRLEHLGDVAGHSCWMISKTAKFYSYAKRKRSTYVLLSDGDGPPRTKRQIACLLRLSKRQIGYQVEYVNLRPSKRGSGIAKSLYRFLATNGFTIVSGSMQTIHSERLWVSLSRGRRVYVRYYDFKENRVGRVRVRLGKLYTDTGIPIHGNDRIVMLLKKSKRRRVRRVKNT